MLSLARECALFPGDFIECGVYRGGLTTQLASLGRMVYACDTFAGLPKSGPEDNYHKAGDFSDTSLPEVMSRWEEAGVLPFICPKVGLFSESFPEMIGLKFCFGFVDADYYSSTKEAFEFIYPRLSPGGWLITDDYHWPHCLGVNKAVDEFLLDKPEKLVQICGHQWGLKKL